MEKFSPNKHFIYVFSDSDKNSLLQDGFALIKNDSVDNVYVFKNEGTFVKFDFRNSKHVLSDILTF